MPKKYTDAQLNYLTKSFIKSAKLPKDKAAWAAKRVLEHDVQEGKISTKQLQFLVYQGYDVDDVRTWDSFNAWLEIKSIKDEESAKEAAKKSKKKLKQESVFIDDDKAFTRQALRLVMDSTFLRRKTSDAYIRMTATE
jgi:hypothetical protein